jgi:DNA-binding CsgD family transcriptional regulator
VICFDREEDGGIEERQRHLLQIIKPAFIAGVDAFRVADPRFQLDPAFDLLSDPVALYTVEGLLLHENRVLSELIRNDVGAPSLAEAMRNLAIGLARFMKGDATDRLATRNWSTVVEGEGRYRVSATWLAESLIHPKGSVLVIVNVLQRPPLRVEAVRLRFSLTPAQAAVAALLAEGMSYGRIAFALGISVHTVRRHTEKIYHKLDVHSRSEAALRLQSDEG